MRYSFEKILGESQYQVRLNGEFVCYVPMKDSKLVDQILKSNGFESRTEFLKYCITDN